MSQFIFHSRHPGISFSIFSRTRHGIAAAQRGPHREHQGPTLNTSMHALHSHPQEHIRYSSEQGMGVPSSLAHRSSTVSNFLGSNRTRHQSVLCSECCASQLRGRACWFVYDLSRFMQLARSTLTPKAAYRGQRKAG